MQDNAALVEPIRQDLMPDNPLKDTANILVMSNVDVAQISDNLLCIACSKGDAVESILMGIAKLVHILTPITSVRRIVNMTALVVVEAQSQSQ